MGDNRRLGENGATMKTFLLSFSALLAAAAAFAAPVDEAVARAVAEERVSAFFPGENWRAVDRIAAVDGDGAPAAWAFVFALADGAYAADGAVRAAVRAGEDGSDGESALYAGTATVVTGANDTDSLVFRTFRGLADWYQAFAAADGAGELVRLGAGDIRFASSSGAAARSAAGKASSLRKTAKARAAARAAERQSLPGDLRALAEEAETEAAAAARARWSAAAVQTKEAERAAALRAAGLAE